MESKYELLELLGSGSFGSIFIGKRKKTGEKVAIKMERFDSPIQTIRNETTILNYLNQNGCDLNIPCIFWYGLYKKEYLCFVMTYYNGRTLDTSFREKRNDWMISAINILEKIHRLEIIHRDIKPAHFLFDNSWHLIDFGLATISTITTTTTEVKGTQDQEIKENIQVGTPNYASINLHMGNPPTEKDDLISLGYIYLELLLGYLPWTNDPNKSRYKNWDVLSGFLLEINSSELHHFLRDLYFCKERDKIKYGVLRSYFLI